MAGVLVGGAALGAVFQTLFEVVKTVAKKGYLFRRKLKRMTKKLSTLHPLIQEVTKLNINLDMSGSNTDILKVMSDGAALVAQMQGDSDSTRFWKFPGNTGKLNSLEDALDELRQVILLQGAIAGMRNNALLTTIADATVPPPGSGCCRPPAPPRFDVGLDIPLRRLTDLLIDDEYKDDDVVVLVAPPGCGKTTLLHKLCNHSPLTESFEGNILFLKVSRRPDLGVIAGHIYEHYGRKLPDFKDEEDGFNFLGGLLSQTAPLLLVLDDVWPESEALIDRLRFNIPRYKMLITSRSEITRFGHVYKLDTLSNDNAVAILSYHAGIDDRNKTAYHSLVLQVVERCKRCPLALKLLGSALRGRRQEIWRCELEKWTSVLDSQQDLLLRLESSVEFLAEKEETLKECFIDVAAFPEGRRIPATALIDIWTELYGIKEETAVRYLFDLNTLNMATLVVTRRDVDEDDKYYSEHFVTLHDMLRELALHYTSKKSGNNQRLVVDLPANDTVNLGNTNARLLSFSTDGRLSSEWQGAQVSETQVLVLNVMKNDPELPEFLDKAEQLKVLTVTNYGFHLSELGNFQTIQYLTNLKKMRLERVEIPPLASIKLHNLQKLTFFMCKVRKAFSALNISETFPNLEELHINYCGDLVKLPNGVCDLAKMKMLSITHCHKLSTLPEEIGRMSTLEVIRLRSCIDLTDLPASFCNLARLNFVDISECFSIKDLPEDIGNLSRLEKLNMKGCSRIQSLPASVLDFEESLEVVCDEDIKELWESHLPEHSQIQLTLASEDINLNFL